MIYLDNAATTLQKPESVKKAIISALDLCGNSGRGAYRDSMNAADIVYSARVKTAEMFGVKAAENVIFTHNATHALNIAIKGVADAGHCVISGYEHNSVLRPIEKLSSEGRISYSVARGELFCPEGMIKAFLKEIKRDTKFCVMTHVSNVFGYILPVYEIDRLCFKKGIKLIIDASQSAGSVPLDMSNLRATVCICAPGHKGLYGPQGTGILLCKDGEKLNTLTEGGTGSLSSERVQPAFLPDRHESGTLNAHGIAGLSAGIDYVASCGIRNILKHERGLIRYAASELSKMKDVRVFYSQDNNLQSSVLSFVSAKKSNERISEMLANEDVAVRSGLHCSPLAHETAQTKNGTVRISVSDFTTEKDMLDFIAIMRKII